MSNEKISVMDAIYRNAAMGTSSIKSIMNKVDDDKLKDELEKQLEYYSKSLSKIESEFAENGKTPNDINPVIKGWAELDIKMQTLVGCDSSKIAQLMIEGTNMGIIEIEKSMNSNSEIPITAKLHGESVIRHEKKYIDELKAYL